MRFKCILCAWWLITLSAFCSFAEIVSRKLAQGVYMISGKVGFTGGNIDYLALSS